MHWALLFLAIASEVAGTICIKLSQGFTRLVPSVLMFCFYGLSFGLMTLAIKRIPISVAYAVWSGVGTLAVALVGMGYFREPATLIKGVSIGLIILGVIGLNLGGGH